MNEEGYIDCYNLDSDDLILLTEGVESLSEENLKEVFAAVNEYVMDIRQKAKECYDAYIIATHEGEKGIALSNSGDYDFRSQQLRKAVALRSFIRAVQDSNDSTRELPPDDE